MFLHDLPEHSSRFVEMRDAILMRCECCELPTIAVAADRWYEVDWHGTMFGCVVCGWENLPADENGNPIADDSSEDRNDGIALADAKRNFGIYSWMYDPEHTPEWLGAPISREERRLRERLRDAYPTSADLPDLSDRLLLVDALKEEIRVYVLDRERRAEADKFNDRDSAT